MKEYEKKGGKYQHQSCVKVCHTKAYVCRDTGLGQMTN